MDACTRSMALAASGFIVTLIGIAYYPTQVGLALAMAGVLLYSAARALLNKC